MKSSADGRMLAKLQASQRGVFSTADLRTAMADPHAAAFNRRVRALLNAEVLFRFCRGFYVARDFDLPVLSQRIAPGSCISFETVLARDLVIGTNPARRIVAMKIGRTRKYAALGFEIEHLGVSDPMSFGCDPIQGVRYSNAERAVLDVLYFHLRGRRYAFDIYSDINLEKLDKKRLRKYLTHYRNPKFVTFAKRVLEIA